MVHWVLLRWFSALRYSAIVPLVLACGYKGYTQIKTQPYRLIETVYIGQKMGHIYPSILQPSSVAIDAVRHRAYCSSRLSPFLGVFRTDSIVQQVGIVHAPFTPQGEHIQLVAYPGHELVYLSPINPKYNTSKILYAIDSRTSQVNTTATYSASIADMALHARQRRLYVADGQLLKVFDAITLIQTDTISLPFVPSCIVLDSAHNHLYVVAKEPVQGQGRFLLYTLTPPYTLLKSLTFPATMPVVRAFVDTNWNRFLVAMSSAIRVMQLESNAHVRTIPLHGTYTHFVYSPSTAQCFALSAVENGSYIESGNLGKLLALGVVSDTRDSLWLEHKPCYMALDDGAKRLAIAYQRQATLSWHSIDSLKSSYTYTDLALHFDDMVLSPDGQALYMASHLGGKHSIAVYHFPEQQLSYIPSGTWVPAFATDSLQRRIFALSHQANTIFIISMHSRAVIGKIPLFGFKEQRGDILSTMCYDKFRQKMYVALPEHKSIAVVDLSTGATQKTLKLLGFQDDTKYSFVGRIQMVVAPEVNKLYVLRAAQKRLNIYNLNSYTLIDSLNVASHWSSAMDMWTENLLAYDPVDRRVYVGGIAIDCNTNKVVQVLPGVARFLGYDAKETVAYSVGQSGSVILVQEHEPNKLAVTASRALFVTNEPISPLVALDTKRNHLYFLDRLAGALRRYDLRSFSGAGIAKSAEEEQVTLSIYPTVVNSQATVRFGVKRRERVRLSVLDASGREIHVLTDSEYGPGTHTITLKVEGSVYSTELYTLQLRSPTMFYTKTFQVQR
ncbi:MAG: hypothetical protein RML40_03700 [Bacteroidota bacterium]|nr:hypothetical protein [Candidatus Kapabacteria bacterium]MDW8219616.1 hypothetical protein [Bacteroidota bacterium]